MALCGYCLETKENVASMAEESGKGPSFEFFSEIARKLNCYVFAGYPENLNGEFYNSLYCIGRTGELLLSYQKHFLYEVDKPLYKPGPSFKTLMIKTLGGKNLKVAPAICMDLNPEDFGPFEKYELANFVRE